MKRGSRNPGPGEAFVEVIICNFLSLLTWNVLLYLEGTPQPSQPIRKTDAITRMYPFLRPLMHRTRNAEREDDTSTTPYAILHLPMLILVPDQPQLSALANK